MCFDPDEELCGDHHIIPGNYEERHGKLTFGRVHRCLGVRWWRILEACWPGEIRYRDLGDRMIIPIDAITEFLAKPNAERPDASAASLSITKVASNERFEPTNTTPPTPFDDYRLLRLREVLHLCGISRSALYEMVSRGAFPQLVQIGVRSVGWRQREIRE